MVAKKAAKKPTKNKPVAKRADFGAPIDGAIANSPHAALVGELRALIEKAVPEATSSLKWGMPNWSIGKAMVATIGMHKAHVNLILSGPASIFVDPDGLLDGEGKTGRRLVLQAGAKVPAKQVKTWLAAAAKHARAT